MPAAASSSRAIVAAEDDSIRHDSMTYASGGRISHLEVVNFKSYGGTRTIGPFLGFTAVVGPNGAGKSNLMDALSFVCAVNAKDLRGKQLKDLIYRSTSDTGDEERSASVALVFQRGDKEIVFKREINSSGVGTFRIDGRKVDAKAYHDRMQAEGIMTKAHTGFLVFQGYVAELAAKSPMELTALFESISGSDAYKEDYERLDAEKKRAEDEQSYAYQKKKLLTQERTNVRKQKEEAEKYTELQEQLKEHKRRLALLRLFHIETEVQSLHEAAASCRQEADAEAAKHAELEEQVGVQESTLGTPLALASTLASAPASAPTRARARSPLTPPPACSARRGEGEAGSQGRRARAQGCGAHAAARRQVARADPAAGGDWPHDQAQGDGAKVARQARGATAQERRAACNAAV